jgi:polyhydroxybutyrate depolymerase
LGKSSYDPQSDVRLVSYHMAKLQRTLTQLLLVFCLVFPFGSYADEPWTSGSHTMKCDGLERRFLLDVPADLMSGSALVLVFHGYTDTAEGTRKSAGFTALATQHGFVAVYPQGTRDTRGNTFFNVGYQFHADHAVDDVSFVRQLVQRLVPDLKIDSRKVFATGMSNGGDMSYFLAVQPEPFVTAIAPVAGTMMCSWGKELVPKARIPVLAIHGTADKTTLWEGDLENRDGWGAYLSVESVIERWVKGYSLEHSEVTDLPYRYPGAVTRVRLKRWWTATDSTEVKLYELLGGGHEWPTFIAKELSPAQIIWKFFSTSPLQPANASG